MSLSAGVDYGLAWKFMPELSFVEKLLLQSFTVFGHLFKATSASGVSIKGALIALRTDAKDIMLQRKKLEEDRFNSVPVLLPRRTINMDIQFLGKLFMWNRIKSESTARLEFISLHKKVFHVSSDNLAIWSNFIIHRSSSGRINTANGSIYQLDPVALQQENLDSIVHQMILSSTEHDSSSIEARIDEEVRKSVVGRDEESKDCSNGVENYFLNDNENCKEGVEEFNRIKVFEHVLRQIPLEIQPTTQQPEGGPQTTSNPLNNAVNVDDSAPVAEGIRYDKNSIVNEYTNTSDLLEGPFPYLFPHGYPYGEEALSVPRLQHMLNQGSNAFSNDALFVSLTFDMMKRRGTSVGVAITTRSDPESIETMTKTINDPTFPAELKYCVDNPKSKEAKEMEKWISKLILKSSKNIPFSTVQSSIAFSQLLALDRFFGNGAFFLTVAPSTWKYALLYRLTKAHQSNHGDLNNFDRSISIPDTNSERKATKMSCPYADVRIYIMLMESIIQHILHIGQRSALTKRADSSVLPWNLRKRGLLGNIHSTFTATENSEDGHLHAHLLISSAIDWKGISQFAGNPLLNKYFGEFMDSIISTELSSLRVFDNPDKPVMDNPTKMWMCNDSTDLVANGPLTQTTLPITSSVLTEIENTLLPDSCFPVTLPTSIRPFSSMHFCQLCTPKTPKRNLLQLINNPNARAVVMDAFWKDFEHKSFLLENHGNHNFSCWKEGKFICRFSMPAIPWNQISGIIEVRFIRGNLVEGVKDSFEIASRVGDVTIDREFMSPDCRNLIYQPTRRTNDSTILRDPSSPHIADYSIEWAPHIDEGRNNGLMSPVSATILVGCGGGGGCHNNLQFVQHGGMGENSYVCKYIGKGVGKMTATLPALYEAKTSNKTSVHPDLTTNPMRGTAYILQKSINNYSKKREYPNQLMLAHLLGLHQFSSSHTYQFIPANIARKVAFANRKNATAGVHMRGVQHDVNEGSEEEEIDADVDSDSDSDADVHAETNDIIKNVQHALDLEDIAANGQLVVTRNSGSDNKGDGKHSLRPYNVSVVSLLTDYQARGELLKDLNFLEFCLLISKTDKPLTENQTEAMDVVLEQKEPEEEVGEKEAADSDLEAGDKEVVDDVDANGPFSLDRLNLISEFVSSEAMDVVLDDAAIPVVTTSKRLKRGPARNCRFPMMHTNLNLPAHPEMDKKEFMIRSKQKVPLLSGTHVPRMPKKSRWNDAFPSAKVSARQWDKEATDWASFFMCILIPWELDTGLPPYDLTYEGMYQFIRRFDDVNEADKTDPATAEAIIVHDGRLRYLENCGIAGYKNNEFDKTRNLMRKKSADTKTFCELQHKLGARSGHGIAGDSSINPEHEQFRKERDELVHSEYMVETIRELREVMEYNAEQAEDPVNVERLQNARTLFCVSHDGTSERVEQQTLVLSPDFEKMSADYNMLKSFVTDSSGDIRQVLPGGVTLSSDTDILIHLVYADAMKKHMVQVETLNQSQRPVYDMAAEATMAYFKWEKANLYCSEADRSTQPEQLRIIIQGGPGSGKTYLMTIFAERFRIESRRYDQMRTDIVGIAAPTAAASGLFDTGKTIHALVGLISTKDNAFFARELDNDPTGIKEKIFYMLMLLLDEMSMITMALIMAIDARFQQVKKTKRFMGNIPFIFIVGDFRQLCPGVGGIKSTIMNGCLTGKDPFHEVLRSFKRMVLVGNPRADKDPWQQKLLESLNNETYPITVSLLRESCEFCLPIEANAGDNHSSRQRIYPIPHKQCTHLHFLNPSMVRARPEFLRAPVIYPGHNGQYTTLLVRLQVFAESINVPVFRWRLPAATPQSAEKINALHEEGNAIQFPQLFGYYVQDLPIKVNFNANLDARVVNGSPGTLYSLCPIDRDDFDSKIATVRRDQPNNCLAGIVIDIDTPLGVYLTCPEAVGEFSKPGMVCLLSNPTGSDVVKRNKKPINLSKGKKWSTYVRVFNSGYNSGLGGTGYAFEGQTLPHGNGVDLNFTKGIKITLAFLIVALSRVERALDCFIMPFSEVKNPTEELLLIRHPNEWFIWNNSYDENGVFQKSLIKPIAELIQLKLLLGKKSPRPTIFQVPSTIFSKPLPATQQHQQLSNSSSVVSAQPYSNTSSSNRAGGGVTQHSPFSSSSMTSNELFSRGLLTPRTTFNEGIANIGNTCYLNAVVQVK